MCSIPRSADSTRERLRHDAADALLHRVDRARILRTPPLPARLDVLPPRQERDQEPAQLFADLPTVTIQLPIFNEQFVIDRLVEAVCRMNYPREKLEIQVLDDSTDETTEVARGVVERYAAMGHRIAFIHRTNREGYKAGALQERHGTLEGRVHRDLRRRLRPAAKTGC